jgi:hypothetical protein
MPITMHPYLVMYLQAVGNSDRSIIRYNASFHHHLRGRFAMISDLLFYQFVLIALREVS